MILFKNPSLNILILLITIFSSNRAWAQCSQPAWSYCLNCYTAGDIVSYSGQDWVLGSTGQGWRTPGSLTGPNFWVANSGACESPTPPTLAPTEVRGTYCTTSFGVGTVTNDGGATVTARGFVFSLSSDPNINDDAVLLDAGTGTGDEFEGLMDNLTPETTYYTKTYATNSEGTAYGTEISFTTRATADCEPNCALACDITDASLLDPIWAGSTVISIDDTVCITQDVTISGVVAVQGMMKICNGAEVTFSGSIEVQRASLNGQIVFEGCDEIFDGVGDYKGVKIDSVIDYAQMISYCDICSSNDESQFFKPSVSTDLWGATCRPTSTLLTPLPVELTKFTVQKDKNGALLNWTTNSEINNSHFEVELSHDGVNWNTIGIVQGAGNSFEINTYQFTHNEIASGIHYYRLKQIDFDGAKSYSNVKHLSFDNKSKPKSFVAFQNQNNKVEVQALFNGMGEAFLIDTRGKIVEQMTFISTNKSGLNLEFNSINLTKGIYFVKIKSDNALLGEKVQILK
jgi:hypothetical protein